MILYKSQMSKIPNYYSTMYQDGYTPNEILFAHWQMMTHNYLAQKVVEDDITEVKLTSEVKVK